MSEHRVLLLDIEGTTTPISFVYETLFPYAREHVGSFLRQNADTPAVIDDLSALADQAGRDVKNDVEGVELFTPDDVEAAIDNVQLQMDNDRKTTALKSLQGKIWRAGYDDGSLKGEVFPDVPSVLKEMAARPARICIYSSGSVAAQKLLFGFSEHGDLTRYLDGYFDTTTGSKKQSSSYEAISAELQVEPREVLFATDNLDEARAARDAGMRAVILDRPGNASLPDHDFEVWQTLEPALEEFAERE